MPNTNIVAPSRSDTTMHYRQVAKFLLEQHDGLSGFIEHPKGESWQDSLILEVRKQVVAEPWTIFATVNTSERREEDLNGTRGHKLLGRMDRRLLGWAFNKRRDERSEYYGFAEWTRRNNYHAHFVINPASPTDDLCVPTANAALRAAFAELYVEPFVERNWQRFKNMKIQELNEVVGPSLHMAVIPLTAVRDRIKIVNYVTKNYYDPILRDMAMFRKNKPIERDNAARR